MQNLAVIDTVQLVFVVSPVLALWIAVAAISAAVRRVVERADRR